MTAVPLWVQAHTGHQWRIHPDDSAALLCGALAAAIVVAVLSPAARRITGAGAWSMRTAVTLAVVMVTMTAIGGLFHRPIAPHYAVGVVLLAIAAGVAAMPRSFELYSLSAVALGLDTLLVAGLARLLFEGGRGDGVGTLLFIGIAAATLLAATVSAILKLARRAEASA